jgi:hypothetical protein
MLAEDSPFYPDELDEALETTKVHEADGPSFRTAERCQQPAVSVSTPYDLDAGLIGGGQIPKPGREVSAAQRSSLSR